MNISKEKKYIYFYKEILVRSLEGRDVDIFTLTSTNSQTEEREPNLLGLFPDCSKPRAHKFINKKYVFISGRVHPGEVAASHMLNGLINFLFSDPESDPRVRILLDNFVFVVVPFLNPDGVYRGHYRQDTQGVNLNRVYLTASLQKYPTIYAADKIIGSLTQQNKLYMYLDFHAHANINNVFMFGNNLPFHVIFFVYKESY